MGHPTYLDGHYILVGQGSALLAVGVDGVVQIFFIFSVVYLFSVLSPSP